MEHNKIPLRMRIALQGTMRAPKLFTALQLAYGLCGEWEKIMVINSASTEQHYQHLGHYNSLQLPEDATPQRYLHAFNLSAGCGKQVVIFSSFSNEWEKGVEGHLNTSYYEEILSAHGHLMRILRNSPVHVICCIDTKQKFMRYDPVSKRSWAFVQQPVQQPDYDRNFTTVIKVFQEGQASSVKDTTEVLPKGKVQPLTSLDGAMFQEWCVKNHNAVPPYMQERIDRCSSREELYNLMLDEEIEGELLIAAFTKRRLELEGQLGTASSSTSGNDNKLHLVQ